MDSLRISRIPSTNLGGSFRLRNSRSPFRISRTPFRNYERSLRIQRTDSLEKSKGFPSQVLGIPFRNQWIPFRIHGFLQILVISSESQGSSLEILEVPLALERFPLEI